MLYAKCLQKEHKKKKKKVLKGVDFFLNSAILFSVREIKNNMKNEKPEVNVRVNVKRNPTYKGNHCNARTDGIITTFPLGMTEADMIKAFHSEFVNIDINGKRWTKGEMIQVVSLEIGGICSKSI